MTRTRYHLLLLSGLLGCAAPAAAPALSETLRELQAAPERAQFEIRWRGQVIGSARETLLSGPDGFELTRKEQLLVERGGEPVTTDTLIRIRGPALGRASHVEWHVKAGPTELSASAELLEGRWQLPDRSLPGNAIPMELVPWLENRNTFDGPVFLPGFSFAFATLTTRRNEQEVVAKLTSEHGDLVSLIEVDALGLWRSVRSGDLTSHWVEGVPRPPRTLPDLVEATRIPVRGRPSRHLRLENLARPAPTVDGIAIESREDGWDIAFPSPRSPSTKISASVGELRAALAPLQQGLSAPLSFASGEGPKDCTASAIGGHAFLKNAGWTARVVTGLRFHGGALHRHRWLEIRDKRGWVGFDPSTGTIPLPPGRYVPLAVHSPAYSDIAMVDAIVFTGTESTTGAYH